MAVPSIISAEQYHDIFGSSEEENNNREEENNTADSDGSDIDFQEVESDLEEDESDSESDNDSNASDTIEWSDELEDFDIDEFSGRQEMKFNVPDNVSANDFFSQLFGDSIMDIIVTETNRYARQKLANTPRLEKWKDITKQELRAYFGICIIMGINNLPRIAMYWSTDPFIGNTGIQSVMARNCFEELSQYLHFTNSETEPPCSKNKLRQGEKVRAQRDKLVFTKWHDKRDISFLSTNVLPSEPARVVPRQRHGRNFNIEKPRVADVYTSHMGGVDRADQLRSFYFTGYSSRKWYRYIFWFLFNLSICNAFVLESFHRTTRGQGKREMINFRLDLAKQLIDGFSQRKRKRRSQEPQQHSVAREAHVSVHVEGGKRKCVLCSKAGRRTPKGYKVETRFECSLCKVALCRTMCHNLYHDQAE